MRERPSRPGTRRKRRAETLREQRDRTVNVTTLSGDIGTAGSTSDNCYHVVVGSGTDVTAVLDGFWITAGNANGSSPNNCGGGMCNYSSSSPTLTNCTFTANSSLGSGGGIRNYSSFYPGSGPVLANCILWGNLAPDGSQIYPASGVAVTYCVVQGGYAGTGNINVAPQFVRSTSPGPDGAWDTPDDWTDLRLLLTSPCIDAGDNSAVPTDVPTDPAGNPRFVDVPAVPDSGSGTPPMVDMGAYESPNPNMIVAGADDFTLGLTADHASLRIGSSAGANTYAVAAITSLGFTGGTDADRLTVDFANGNPVPGGKLVFDGGTEQEPGDCLIVKDFAGATGVTVAEGQVLLTGLATINYTRAMVVLDGQNDYSGAMTVEGGTVRVDGPDALPAGTALAIHSGTVVLRSGLGRAIELAGLEIALAGVPSPACGAGVPPAICAAGTAAPQDRAAGTAEVGTVVSIAPSPLSAVQSLMTASAAACRSKASVVLPAAKAPEPTQPTSRRSNRPASPSAPFPQTGEGSNPRQFAVGRSSKHKSAATNRAFDAVLETFST